MRILILILIIAVLYYLERKSLQDCFRGFSYSIRPEKTCVMPDEEFRVDTVLENDKWMPMLFIRLYEYVPKVMTVVGKDHAKAVLNQEYDQDTRVLVQSLYLLPHQKAKRTFTATMDRRGRYLLGKTRIRCGDLLGLKEKNEAFMVDEELVVYPRTLPLDAIEPAFGGYLGEMSVRRFIMPDPILVSATWFNMLTPEEQEGVLKAGEEYTRVWNEEIWPDAEEAALKTIAEAGCEVNEIDKAPFIEATQSVRDDFASNGTPEQVELYNLLLEVRG